MDNEEEKIKQLKRIADSLQIIAKAVKNSMDPD